MNEKPKFKVGDKVEIVNYGHALLTNDALMSEAFKDHWIGGNPAHIDMHSSLVGQQGTIAKVENGVMYGDGRIVFSYAIDGLDKYCPYHEDQLKLIE